MRLNPFAYAEFPLGCELELPAGVKNLVGFDPSFENLACLSTL